MQPAIAEDKMVKGQNGGNRGGDRGTKCFGSPGKI
jgi:hypothetical protein